jgi:protein SCO1/2
MKKNTMLKISLVVLVLIIIGWGVILYQLFAAKSKADFYGNVYDREVPDFTLTDQNGSKVSLSDFRGRLVFIFFGYAHCPDICPVTLSALNSAVRELGDEQDEVQVLFVTVDPERDDQEALKNYVPYFNKSFIGLTGTPEEIKEVADSFGVYYVKEETDSADDYYMGHTSSVYLLDKDGKIIMRYPQSKMEPGQIAADLKKIL